MDKQHGQDRQDRRVTVIGLGLMGRALAEAYLRAGYETTVWNRTAGRAEPLVAQGARLAGSVREAVEAAPLVIVCVTDYPAARGLLDPVAKGFAGRLVVNLTSGTSADGRATAAWVSEQGGTYLDGAILDLPSAIGTASAVVVHSGPADAFASHEEALRVLGGGTTYLGEDPGLAALYDTAVLGLMWNVLNGFLHGAALLGAAGVEAPVFAEFARESVGTMAGWLPRFGRDVAEGAYPAVDATLATHVSAMEHLVHESEALGVGSELPRFVKELAERAVEEGHGDEGYAVLFEQFRGSGGVRGSGGPVRT